MPGLTCVSGQGDALLRPQSLWPLPNPTPPGRPAPASVGIGPPGDTAGRRGRSGCSVRPPPLAGGTADPASWRQRCRCDRDLPSSAHTGALLHRRMGRAGWVCVSWGGEGEGETAHTELHDPAGGACGALERELPSPRRRTPQQAQAAVVHETAHGRVCGDVAVQDGEVEKVQLFLRGQGGLSGRPCSRGWCADFQGAWSAVVPSSHPTDLQDSLAVGCPGLDDQSLSILDVGSESLH